MDTDKITLCVFVCVVGEERLLLGCGEEIIHTVRAVRDILSYTEYATGRKCMTINKLSTLKEGDLILESLWLSDNL